MAEDNATDGEAAATPTVWTPEQDATRIAAALDFYNPGSHC